MADHKEVEFEGFDCIQLKNDHLALWLTKDVGLRILGLSYQGGESILVILPDAVIPVEGASDYTLRGGHRLWYAPEIPKITYITDDKPVETKIKGTKIEQIQPIDQPTGIQKSWRIELDPDRAEVKINHLLENRGSSTFELAPWAISMLRPGGIGCIPLNTDLEDEFGLQPNRQLVLWPYTDISSPCLKFTERALFVSADMKEGALKIGAPNPLGWIAYSYNGTLFIKKTAFQGEKYYLDRYASSQIYCNPDLIELETLGPVVRLKPGEGVEHMERWQIYPEGGWPANISELFEELKK
jgi:hypothetical protein